MKIKIVAFKASKRTMALILVSVLLIISVIGLVDYKVAFEHAQESAIFWRNLSRQYIIGLEEANRELGTANRTIFNQDTAIAALRQDIVNMSQKHITEIAVLKKGGKDFNSLSALQGWLWWDDTNLHEYIPNVYDCDDYAFDLMQAALQDGYRIGLYQKGQHVVNFALVGDTPLGAWGVWGTANKVYIIEPQTDEVRFWGYRD